MDVAFIQLVVSLVSVGLMAYFMVYMARQQNNVLKKFTPVVSKVMKGLGNQSVDAKEIKAFEKDMIGDVIDKGLPELGLLQEMGILSDERMEWIKDHPEGLMVLLERYGPMAMRLMKMRGGSGFNQKTQAYDF